MSLTTDISKNEINSQFIKPTSIDHQNQQEQQHHHYRKDYRTNVLDNYYCDEYIFSSNFDSGNLGRVELFRRCSEADATENVIHTEFNVWTTPDCYGTVNQSPNRTWFFFSIKGGRPYKNVKINVKNLNRQSKLFAQGMQPVIRIGQYGKWERIKNKPTYNMENENFCMSFIHQTLDKCDIEHFYAFTYPFTYTECQNMLERFDEKYQKSVHDVNFIINKLISTEIEDKNNSTSTLINASTMMIKNTKSKKQVPLNEIKKQKIRENVEENVKEINNIMDAIETVTSSSSSTSIDIFKNTLPATNEMIETDQLSLSSPSSSSLSSSPYENYTRKQLLNEIYYHRETLINSLEGRKVELLTITSFHGIQSMREERLSNLFPDSQQLRCHTFKDKKIIFMSSRVHPGETPASFVLNGFLNLILDKKSIIAQTLRQLYIFKIVPILNPDGVYRGFYRTDTLGQNLNRMYINPKLEIHPSIYAVKKLIRFHHFGFDNFDTENFIETMPHNIIDIQIKSNNNNNNSSDNNNNGDDDEDSNENLLEDDKSNRSSQSCSFKDSTPSSSSDIDDNNQTKSDTISSNCTNNNNNTNSNNNNNNNSNNNDHDNSNKLNIENDIKIECKRTSFTDRLIPEIKTCVRHNNNNVKEQQQQQQKKFIIQNRDIKNSENLKMKKLAIKTILNSSNKTTTAAAANNNSYNKIKDNINQTNQQQQQQQRSSISKRIIIKKDIKSLNATKNMSATLSTANNNSHNSNNNNNNNRLINKRNILSNHNPNSTNTTNISIKSNNLKTIEKGCIEENTNMFLYIDFHGHASKKGVFMYGNHFSNSADAVECMLLPRLMSINCHHFHYDACNFSERNMYRREKRDGLSKEGSGRVAIFKMTGLIKSYTLESNYNTGKYVNNIPARGKEINSIHHVAKSINLNPPKYTPAIYEEVGRALGPSILDITNSNVLSRIHNSEFRTIQGLRITLRNEIEKTYSNQSHHRSATATTAGGSSSSSFTAPLTGTTASTANTTAAVVTTAKATITAQQCIKRIKRNARKISSALPKNDTTKENKAILYSIPSWIDTNTNNSNNPTSTLSSSTSSTMKPILLKSQSSINRSTKLQLLKLPRSNNNGNGGNGSGSISGSARTIATSNCGNNGTNNITNNNTKKTTGIKIRSNTAASLYSTKKELSSSIIINKKKSNLLSKKDVTGTTTTTTTTVSLTGTRSVTGTGTGAGASKQFYIPPKKVKISNKNYFKRIIKSSRALPSSFSSSSSASFQLPQSSLSLVSPLSSSSSALTLSSLPSASTASSSTNFLQKFPTAIITNNPTEKNNCNPNNNVSSSSNNNDSSNNTNGNSKISCCQSYHIIDDFYESTVKSNDTKSSCTDAQNIHDTNSNNVISSGSSSNSSGSSSSSDDSLLPLWISSANIHNKKMNSNDEETLDYRAIPSSSKLFMHANHHNTTVDTITSADQTVCSPYITTTTTSGAATTIKTPETSVLSKNLRTGTDLFIKNNSITKKISKNNKKYRKYKRSISSLSTLNKGGKLSINLIKKKSSLLFGGSCSTNNNNNTISSGSSTSNINTNCTNNIKLLHKKRINRHETIIIKRKRNKIKSTNSLRVAKK